MGRSSASHGKKPPRKLPRKQWQTDEAQASVDQAKVFRSKEKRVRKDERVVDTTVQLKRRLSAVESRVRALNKKLREIERLQKRAAEGLPLDEQQQQKLASLGGVLAEMEEVGLGV
ncbi:hypothetical protein KFE25_012335 [Diacronema lutheri]|uniref:Uncharacterized protein n=2 Tax=Diacronema lutheri TaxID=2081491 RepID=A0A8J5XN68_DIALT|nr:hypothetical protein KFE25_012335 [Diacronema lutheri]